MKGEVIAHYRLEEKLLDSPTGPLYKARDTRHDHTVALKILPAGLGEDAAARQSFIEVVRAAGSLGNPAIPAVHDGGESPDGRLFVAMEFTGGETLRSKLASGPLPLPQAISLATQIARALAAAHEKGIVHRDVRPGTVLVDEAGTAKLLDFGVSRLVGAAAQTRTAELSRDEACLAPELLQGQEIDTRADIWSVGALLSESLGGKRGKVPEELRWVVDRCLRKDPRERYGSATELADDLEAVAAGLDKGTLKSVKLRAARRQPRRWAMAGAFAGAAVVIAAVLVVTLWWKPWQPRTAERVTIALLPLEGIDLSEEDAWYAEGVTDMLMTDLVKIRGLRMISLNSTRLFKPADDVKAISERLTCDYVATGTVAKAGEEVTISLNMTRVTDAREVWNRLFAHKADDWFGRIGEVARAVSRAVGVQPTKEEAQRLAGDKEVSPEAFDLFRRSYDAPTMAMETGVEYLERAVALEPDWPAAHAKLLQQYMQLSRETSKAYPDLSRKIEETRRRVLELDPDDPDANLALAWDAMYRRDWDEAESRIQRAQEIRSGDIEIMMAAGQMAYLQGRLDVALNIGREYLRLMPGDPDSYGAIGSVYAYTREYDKALEYFEEAARMLPEVSFMWRATGIFHGFLGRHDLALEHLRKAMELDPDDTTLYQCMAFIYRLMGDRKGVMKWLNALKARYQGAGRQAYDIACIYAILDDADEAFKWIEEQYRLEPSALYFLHMDSTMDPLRSDPRYKEMLKRLNLPEFIPPRNLLVLPEFIPEGGTP